MPIPELPASLAERAWKVKRGEAPGLSERRHL